MKAYFFVSPYLSDIQKGIQVSHCVAEMALTHTRQITNNMDYWNWAQKEKTIVVLSYGTNKDVVERIHWNCVNRFNGFFKERELNDLKTVGVILHEEDMRKMGNMRQGRDFKISKELNSIPEFYNELPLLYGKRVSSISKRRWLGLVSKLPTNTVMGWDDTLRLISTLHAA